ncbi:serine/threonine protein kinase [Plantactinospora sp. GCM10030261]|uniref:serine/threonine protein kinase n=1 Tax=Plantactinospora sp. GCM10030261 TaxID=3273420 RepID=UPI003607D68B
MLSAGVVLNDRYRLDDRIASGGMGDVWSATDTLLKRRIAIKALLPALVSDTEFITRFRTEARLLAALRHPGIVAVYDYGEDTEVDGHRMDYLVMEYIDGTSLSQRIKDTGRLDAAETLSVLAQAGQALHVAHLANIVHRDVKPGNLLVQPDGSVVLVDFGVARSANVTSITGTNIVLGSAHYMAPEQIAGRPLSAATDVYALAAVGYCCLLGRPPFIGENALQVATQHLQDEPPALPADVPASVVRLLTRAMAKDPADRFPSAAAFVRAVRIAQDALASGPTTALPSPPRAAPPQAVTWQADASPRATVTPRGGAPDGTGPTVPRPPAAEPSPVAPTASGRRRRIAALAGVAAVVVAVLGGTALVGVWRGADENRTDPSNQAEAGTSASAGLGPPAEGSGPSASPTATAGADPATSTPGRGDPSAAPPPGPAGTGKPDPEPTTPGAEPPEKNPHTPVEVCGNGYQVINSKPLVSANGTPLARVYLMYNSGNGNNCTVAMKTNSVGVRTQISAYLEVKGRDRQTDSGSFEYYAGPVRARAAGVCVRWGGSTGGASYNSPFEHCG